MRKSFFCIYLAVCIALTAVPASGIGLVQGWAERGGYALGLSGFLSSMKVQRSFPGASITVYIHGTLTKAVIFTDASGTVQKANPFAADSQSGYYRFYTSETQVDITVSASGVAPYTMTSGTLSDLSANYINVGSADARYLKLDTSNDPLTGGTLDLNNTVATPQNSVMTLSTNMPSGPYVAGQTGLLFKSRVTQAGGHPAYPWHAWAAGMFDTTEWNATVNNGDRFIIDTQSPSDIFFPHRPMLALTSLGETYPGVVSSVPFRATGVSQEPRITFENLVNQTTDHGTGQWAAGQYTFGDGTQGTFYVKDLVAGTAPLTIAPTTGNVTVRGLTSNTPVSGNLLIDAARADHAAIRAAGTSSTASGYVTAAAGDGTTSGKFAYFEASALQTAPKLWRFGLVGSEDFSISDPYAGRTPLRISGADGSTTLTAQLNGTFASFNNGAEVYNTTVGQTASLEVLSGTPANASTIIASAGDNTTSSRIAEFIATSYETVGQTWRWGMRGTKDWKLYDQTNTRTPLSISSTDGSTSLLNLTATVPDSGGFLVTASNGSGDALMKAVTSLAAGTAGITAAAGNGTTSSRQAWFASYSTETVPQNWRAGMNGDKNWSLSNVTAGTAPMSVNATTGTATFTGDVRVETSTAATTRSLQVNDNAATGDALVSLSQGDGTTSSRSAYIKLSTNETVPQFWTLGMSGSKDFKLMDTVTSASNPVLQFTRPQELATFYGGVRINAYSSGTPSTCDSTTRGTFRYTAGGAGVKDNVEVCAKDGADVYAWRTIY